MSIARRPSRPNSLIVTMTQGWPGGNAKASSGGDSAATGDAGSLRLSHHLSAEERPPAPAHLVGCLRQRGTELPDPHGRHPVNPASRYSSQITPRCKQTCAGFVPAG